MKELLKNGEVTYLVLIDSKYMLANCMPKHGANSTSMMQVLSTGKIDRDIYLH